MKRKQSLDIRARIHVPKFNSPFPGDGHSARKRLTRSTFPPTTWRQSHRFRGLIPTDSRSYGARSPPAFTLAHGKFTGALDGAPSAEIL